MEKNGEFKHESIQDTTTIIEYLEELKSGFQNGTLQFASDREEITLNPQGMLNMEIKAKKKDGKAKLNLRFSWKEVKITSEPQKLVIKAEDEA